MTLSTIPFQPIGTAVAAMPPRPGTGLPLSDALISQARMVAFEFIGLRQERFGPDSHQTSLGTLIKATEGIADYLGSLQAVESESQVMTRAHLAEQTLREIRVLWQGDHFFTDAMRSFFEGFLKINVENVRFGEKLFRGLKAYRDQRDDAETKFIVPFFEYRDQLRRIIEPIGTQFHFSHWEIVSRVKRRILSKQEARKLPNTRDVFDIAGLMVLLGRQREVDAARNMIRSAFEMHEQASIFDDSIPYYFKIDHIEVHVPTGQVDPNLMESGILVRENDRGYRGTHINSRRFNRNKDKHYANGETQLRTRRGKLIGDEQHGIAYKGDPRIPPEIYEALKAYGRASFALGEDLDEGREVELPKFDLNELDARIEDKAVVYEVLERLMRLEGVLTGLIQEDVQAREEAQQNT